MNDTGPIFSYRQSNDSPRELDRLVKNLCAARLRQIILEVGSRALVGGAVACSVAIALAKWMQLGISLVAIVCVVFAFAVLALAYGVWRRRPDPLAVVIDTDLRLGLHQVLSTAWEFTNAALEAPSSTTDRHQNYELLCAQAVRMRLPVKAERVYPLRASAQTWLAPVAVVVMLLVWFVDWAPAQLNGQPPVASTPEHANHSVEEVMAAGEALWAFSTELRAEAHRKGLERSRRTAEDLRRIASRMQSGRESTARALAHLAELRQRVGSRIRDAASAGFDLADRGDGRGGRSGSIGSIPRELLSRIATSTLTEDDARRLMEAAERAGSGLNASQLRSAIDSYFRGDLQALRDWSGDVGRSAEVEDAAALERAYAALNEAQQRLGGRSSSDGLPRGLAGTAPGGAGTQLSDSATTESENELFYDEDDGDDDEDEESNEAQKGLGNGRDASSYVSRGFERAPAEGEIIRPRSRHGAGPVLRATTRALPRDNSDAVDFAPTHSADDVMTAQRESDSLEQALANQRVPVRYRSYVRDYFRIVSDGARSADEGSR
jgi:hypothetical protein